MKDPATQRNADDQAPCVEGKPAVTWLVATHVANNHLRTAIESCLTQTFENFECLVIINGKSADQVTRQVKTWFHHDDRLRVFSTPVRHLNFSLSLGLHLARAPLVARMDADDIALPDRLEKQVAFMTSNPLVAVLGTQYDVIDEAGNVINHVALPTSNKAIRKRLFYGNPFCHPSVMLRRDAVLEAGGYLGGLYAEDYDLWARLARTPGIEFANMSDIGLHYRSVGAGSARRAHMAYATVGSTQFRQFIAGCGWKWGVAALISIGKAVLKSRR